MDYYIINFIESIINSACESIHKKHFLHITHKFQLLPITFLLQTTLNEFTELTFNRYWEQVKCLIAL